MVHWTIAILRTLPLQSVYALWPAPSQYQSSDQYVKIHESFSIVPRGSFEIPEDLRNAMAAAEKQLKHDKMVPLEVDLAAIEQVAKATKHTLYSLTLDVKCQNTSQPANGSTRNPARHRGKKHDLSSITLDINKPFEGRDESYTLEISLESPVANLTASTALGLLRGLQTFTQLVYTTSGDQATRYIRNAPISIQDEPAYPVRGLLLDTARNYYPVKDIKRTLNAMSYAKMNYFHWHITDSQSWPLVVPSLPELSANAAYYPSQVYDLKAVKDVIAHANAIGIEVMLEIDTPGHTASIAYSYPDLVACTKDPWTVVAAEPNPGQLKPTSDKAIELVKTVYSDVIKAIPGKLFGTGGDEINLACFENDTSVQDVLQAKGQTIIQAISNFVNETQKPVRDAGRTPVIWEDTAVGNEALPLDKNTIVTAWRGAGTFANITAAGYKVIQASYELAYMDCGMGGWVGLGASWCPFVSWWTIYTSLSTLQGLSDAQKQLVLGGQAALWSEQAGPEVVDSLLWPRAAAVGEVWWLGEQGINNQGLNATSALGRLHDFRYRMVQRGIAAKPLQPHWCALRPEQCLA
ncbi:glycoside hydrolase family 20 protein [Cystobasidium minutum MCA 4210]|uniref:glycoside hydrolase family 20 protein n=1 Tax=Cystobasidium minutum MCA 4210 TaxID=1397322 RepID=UPI0034CE1EF0|eukprot:jgi/Rhomi1/46550/CE46549_722